jgi:hypothetical protein
VLAIIASIGADGATGHAIEFAGPTIRALSMEGRLTLCNMSIEAGARSGIIAPDETTFEYVKGRPYSPKGTAFEQALVAWSALTTDDGAEFDREVELNAADIAPIVTWGTSPQDALPIDASVPDPARESDVARAKYLREALDYMGLTPGTKLTNIAINRVLSLFLKKTPLFFIKIPPFPRTKGVRTQAIISNSSFQMKRWRVPATSERGRKSEKRTRVEFNCPARRLCPTHRLGKWQPPRRAADRARRRSERHASCGLGRTCRRCRRRAASRVACGYD